MQRFQPADSENHSAARALSGPSSSGKARNSMRSRSQGDKPLSVFSNPQNAIAALELKYPRNGQYPEQMFSFCKDIAFLESLVASGFQRAFFVAFADDKLFYEGGGEGIYEFFRLGRELHGTITKPTGKKCQSRDPWQVQNSLEACYRASSVCSGHCERNRLLIRSVGAEPPPLPQLRTLVAPQRRSWDP